jgi:hypothetical protein
MMLAQELGALFLSLRNAEDISEQSERTRSTLETLLGDRLSKLGGMRNAIQVIKSGNR